MLLFRLTDAAEDADEDARGPQGLFDFDWLDKFGGRGMLPAMRQSGLTSGLMMPPTGPEDPLWSSARYGLPRRPFGQSWPFFGPPYPAAPVAFPGHPVPLNQRTTPRDSPAPGFDARASVPSDRPIQAALSPSGAAAPVQPAVRGLASLLMDDETDAGAAGIPESPIQTQEPYVDPSLVLAQAGATPPQARPSLDYSLDAIERNFRNIVPGWRKEGLNQAATNLEWFLDGRGDTRIIDRDEARRMEPIRSAEELNSWRTENGFTDPQWPHAEKLKNLKDGESVTIRDYWDRDYKDDSFVRQLLSPSTRDFALAFGNTKFHTVGDFEVSRSGDELFIEGTVLHSWKDRYDFDPDRYLGMGGALAKGAAALEEHRGARPFDIESTWRRRLKGKVRLKDGKLTDPVFTWEDVEE